MVYCSSTGQRIRPCRTRAPVRTHGSLLKPPRRPDLDRKGTHEIAKGMNGLLADVFAIYPLNAEVVDLNEYFGG